MFWAKRPGSAGHPVSYPSYQRRGVYADTNYRGPGVQKGARIAYVFVFAALMSLFIDYTN
jgi:hypothetical protein